MVGSLVFGTVEGRCSRRNWVNMEWQSSLVTIWQR